MRSRHLRLLLAVSIVIASAGAISWEQRATTEAQAQLNTLQNERRLLEQRLARMMRERDSVTRHSSEQAGASTAFQSGAQNTAGRQLESRAIHATPAPLLSQQIAAALDDPSIEKLRLSSRYAEIAQRYRAFFEKQRLTTAQSEQCVLALLERDEQLDDLRAIVGSRELDTNDPSVVRLSHSIAEDFRREMIRVVGNGIYTEFVRYERTEPVRQMVDALAGDLALQGAPLSATQSDQLTQMLADASPPYQRGGTADPNEVIWPVVVPAAAQVLTPPQLEAFRNSAPRYPVAPPPTQVVTAPSDGTG